jgi:threonine synthase
LAKLAAQGVIRSDERVVAMVTGHGLKTVEALSGTVGPSATIPPTLDAFDDAFSQFDELDPTSAQLTSDGSGRETRSLS